MTLGVSPLPAQDRGKGDEHPPNVIWSVFATILTVGRFYLFLFFCSLWVVLWGKVCYLWLPCFQLVTEEVYEKHLQLSCREAESKDTHSYHCATPDCSGWCSFDDDVNSFFCYVCHRVNCITCRAIHDGQNCLEYQLELRAKKYKNPAAMLANSTLEVLVITVFNGTCCTVQYDALWYWIIVWSEADRTVSLIHHKSEKSNDEKLKTKYSLEEAVCLQCFDAVG